MLAFHLPKQALQSFHVNELVGVSQGSSSSADLDEARLPYSVLDKKDTFVVPNGC